MSGANEIVGMDPANGAVLWTHPHKTEWGLNISTPVWGEGNLLFVSAAYNNGAAAAEAHADRRQDHGSGAVVSEPDARAHRHDHPPGRFRVGSSGDFGPCPTVAIDLKTGNILWQNREFARSTFLYADGKLMIMDEDGNLGLATAVPRGPQRARESLGADEPVLDGAHAGRHAALRPGPQVDDGVRARELEASTSLSFPWSVARR